MHELMFRHFTIVLIFSDEDTTKSIFSHVSDVNTNIRARLKHCFSIEACLSPDFLLILVPVWLSALFLVIRWSRGIGRI